MKGTHSRGKIKLMVSRIFFYKVGDNIESKQILSFNLRSALQIITDELQAWNE